MQVYTVDLPAKLQKIRQVRLEVPNLGYMYPQGCICLSEGVYSRLAIEEKISLHIIYFKISTYISVYYFQKTLYDYRQICL